MLVLLITHPCSNDSSWASLNILHRHDHYVLLWASCIREFRTMRVQYSPQLKFEINSDTFHTFCAYFSSFRKDILNLRSQDCSLVIYLLSCLFLSITMLRVNCNSAVVVFLSENRLWPFPDKTWIKCIFIEIISFKHSIILMS